MPSNTHITRRAVLGAVGLVLGGVMTFAEVIYVLVLTPVHAIPAVREGIAALGGKLVELNRRRLVTYLEFDDLLCIEPGWERSCSYLVRRSLVGVIGAAIFVLIGFGLGSALLMTWQVVTGQPIGGEVRGDESGNGNQWYEIGVVVLLGSVLLFVAVWGLIGVAMLERSLAKHYLGPTEEDQLRRRVSELATSRAGVVEAVNDERRRIERDLHDGVQQRLVALGMLLGRALRADEPGHSKELVKQAHNESQQVLHDLREVTWRLYPTALDKDGLRAALEGVAERAIVPVALRYELTTRPDLATETVAYFVVSESVTNALKHGRPMSIAIAVTREESEIVVSVVDHGHGGADVTGPGLSGLASRVAAADGTFEVISPMGGPTMVVARLPVPSEPADVDAVTLVPTAGQRRSRG
jgi:signal transduction histidine kinase